MKPSSFFHAVVLYTEISTRHQSSEMYRLERYNIIASYVYENLARMDRAFVDSAAKGGGAGNRVRPQGTL
jgi:hypothetical protein